MPPLIVVGVIAAVAFALWWVTSGIGRQGGNKKSDALHNENLELRHVVTEMAMERHQSRGNSHHRKSH